MKRVRLFAAFGAACLLTACASVGTGTGVKSDQPPADAMVPCEALPTFNANNSTNTADLIGYNISVMQAYGKCSLKLQSLQAWVKANTRYSSS